MIEKIGSNSGFAEVIIGDIQIIKNYDIILHLINPVELQQILIKLEDNLMKINKEDGRDVLINELKSLTYKVQTIIPHRHARGLINIAGTGMKWLYGTMDDDDRQNIEEHLRIMDTNNHNLIEQSNHQVFINDHFNSSFMMLKKTIENDRTDILKQFDNVKTENMKIINKIRYLELLSQIRIIKDNVEQIQNNIASSRLGIMGNNILTKDEILRYDIDFEKLKNIKLGTAKYKSNKIIFAIKIPKEIIVTKKYLITGLSNENYEKIVMKDEEIVKINRTVYTLDKSTDLKKLKKSNSCIYSQNCIKIKDFKMELLEIEEGLILLKNYKNVSLNSTCDERIVRLNGNYLLNYNDCELQIGNQSFSNRKEMFEQRFIIPSEIELDQIKDQLTFDEIVLNQIENIKHINELKYERKNHLVLNLCIIIVVSFFVIALAIYFSIKTNKLGKVITKTQESFIPKGGVVTSVPITAVTPVSKTPDAERSHLSSSEMPKSASITEIAIDWNQQIC